MQEAVFTRAAPLVKHDALPALRQLRRATGPRYVSDRGPRAPIIRNDQGGPLYCKTVWPGGLGGLINGQPPDPATHVRVSAAAGLSDPRCYPNNLAAVPDLVSDGTYGSGFRFGADGSALTERGRQTIASIQRAADAGRISDARAGLELALTVEADRAAGDTAARGRDLARIAARRAQQQTGKKGKTLTDAELDGICGGLAGPSIWCRTRWPYGLVDLKGMTDAQVRKIEPSYIKWEGSVKADGICPPGSPWWLRLPAYIYRETLGGLNEAGEGVKALVRQAGYTLGRNLAPIAPGVAEAVRQVTGTSSACGQWWSLNAWPGGFICLPEGQTPSDGRPWVPVDYYGHRPAGTYQGV